MKKRKGLFFLGMLFLASILFSCKNDDSDDYPRTVNIKIRGEATPNEQEHPLNEYGKLFMNITQASSDLNDYKEEDSLALPTGSISINKKLTDVMDQFSLEFYLVPATEAQTENLNKRKHGEELGKLTLSYEITSSNGEKKTGEKALTFYADQINFYAKGETPKPEETLIQCNTTDCIWVLANGSMSLTIKDDSAVAIPEEPTYIEYDGNVDLDIDDSSILEIPEHEKRATVNVKFISTPSDDFFNFGTKKTSTTKNLQFGDVAYLAQADYVANKETVKSAFDNGALLMMLGGSLDDVKTIFGDLSIDNSYISETELETDKGDPVFFIGQYSTGEEDNSNTFFEVLYTKEASEIEDSNKIAVNQMARQIILAYNNLDDIVEKMENNPNNPESSIRVASGEEIKNILKNYGTADATISQKLYQRIPINYTWNYLRNGWDGALKKYGAASRWNPNYELVDVHYRKLLVWFIHVYPNTEKGEIYGKHYYYIQDMPSFSYKNTYFGQVTQAVGNDTEAYRKYGSGSSPISIAKTQEFYGREAEISFEPANKSDIDKVEWCYDNPITQDVDLKKSSTSGWSFTAGANGSVGSSGKKLGIKAEASYNFSNTVEWEEKAVSIERLSEPGAANFSWRYKMRPADFKFGWFCRASTEYVDNTPCETAKTSLMPEAYSQYIFSVSDRYITRRLPFKITMKSTLQRLAGKFGTNCCEGNATAEQSDTIYLPYDRYFNYKTNEPSETIVN